MPDDGKVCTFDCLYCEAGYNAQGAGTTGLPTREQVREMLEAQLQKMQAESAPLDVITFSGNGEPTLHPDFKGIIHDTLLLRNQYYPEAKVSVLSNATMAGKPAVKEALLTVDNNILKLDSAIAHTMRAINQPLNPGCLPEGVIDDLKDYNGQCIVQTCLLRGEHNGVKIDNTTSAEIDALIEAYKLINPREVMIYAIDRATPEKNLEKVTPQELDTIKARIEAAGIKVQANG